MHSKSGWDEMNESSIQERDRYQVAVYRPLPLSSPPACYQHGALALNGMIEQHRACWL